MSRAELVIQSSLRRHCVHYFHHRHHCWRSLPRRQELGAKGNRTNQPQNAPIEEYRTTYKSEMATNDCSVLKRDHLTVLAAVPVWEGAIVYFRASVFLDERDHGGPEGFIRQGGCRPELPICWGRCR